MHHQAEVEHSCAKILIAEIEDSVVNDEYFDSKMHVLAEMIKHNIKEEEQPDGMFAEAENSDLDLRSLGAQLFARKQELTAQVEGK
jgi:hypothetical protein